MICSKYPDDSFPRLFWKQQLQAAQLKNAKSMRWHPFMIRLEEIVSITLKIANNNNYNRWCLYLHHLSGKGYELLRDSGCLQLPTSRTLRDYTHYNTTTIGFSSSTDAELFKLTSGCEAWQKMVVVTMDEMYICEGVVYDKHTGEMIGFTDMGDITNHLQRYTHRYSSTLIVDYKLRSTHNNTYYNNNNCM